MSLGTDLAARASSSPESSVRQSLTPCSLSSLDRAVTRPGTRHGATSRGAGYVTPPPWDLHVPVTSTVVPDPSHPSRGGACTRRDRALRERVPRARTGVRRTLNNGEARACWAV